jgi:hypothetical protein
VCRLEQFFSQGEFKMRSNQKSASKRKKSKADIEWDNRILCSDGNCIGIIGLDGRCKECHKPYAGKLPEGFMQDVSEPEDANAGENNDKAPLEAQSPQTESADEVKSQDDIDWQNRTLCSDGHCIGIIGPDGRCKECGKPYDTNAIE